MAYTPSSLSASGKRSFDQSTPYSSLTDLFNEGRNQGRLNRHKKKKIDESEYQVYVSNFNPETTDKDSLCELFSLCGNVKHSVIIEAKDKDSASGDVPRSVCVITYESTESVPDALMEFDRHELDDFILSVQPVSPVKIYSQSSTLSSASQSPSFVSSPFIPAPTQCSSAAAGRSSSPLFDTLKQPSLNPLKTSATKSSNKKKKDLASIAKDHSNNTSTSTQMAKHGILLDLDDFRSHSGESSGESSDDKKQTSPQTNPPLKCQLVTDGLFKFGNVCVSTCVEHQPLPCSSKGCHCRYQDSLDLSKQSVGLSSRVAETVEEKAKQDGEENFSVGLSSESALFWLNSHGFDVKDIRQHIDVLEHVMTPMGFAASRGELKVCEWLYNNGAASDVTVSNATVDHTVDNIVDNGACDDGDEEDDSCLNSSASASPSGTLDEEDFEDMERLVSRPFYLAVSGNHLHVVKWLFEHGAAQDVTCRSVLEGTSPLSIACCLGSLDMMNWLVSHGAAADLYTCDNYGSTLFFNSCEAGHVEVLKWLFEKHQSFLGLSSSTSTRSRSQSVWKSELDGVTNEKREEEEDEDTSLEDYDALLKPNNDGETCMMAACRSKHAFQIVKWIVGSLLSCGAKKALLKLIKATDNSGKTLLTWVCQYNRVALCEWLLSNRFFFGAEPVSTKIPSSSSSSSSLSSPPSPTASALSSSEAILTRQDQISRFYQQPDHSSWTPLKWALNLVEMNLIADLDCDSGRVDRGVVANTPLSSPNNTSSDFFSRKLLMNAVEPNSVDVRIIHLLVANGCISTRNSPSPPPPPPPSSSSSSSFVEFDNIFPSNRSTLTPSAMYKEFKPFPRASQALFTKLKKDLLLNQVYISTILFASTINSPKTNEKSSLKILARLDKDTGNHMRKLITDFVGVEYGKGLTLNRNLCHVMKLANLV